MEYAFTTECTGSIFFLLHCTHKQNFETFDE